MKYLIKPAEVVVGITAILFIAPFAIATFVILVATDPMERANVRGWFK